MKNESIICIYYTRLLNDTAYSSFDQSFFHCYFLPFIVFFAALAFPRLSKNFVDFSPSLPHWHNTCSWFFIFSNIFVKDIFFHWFIATLLFSISSGVFRFFSSNFKCFFLAEYIPVSYFQPVISNYVL